MFIKISSELFGAWNPWSVIKPFKTSFIGNKENILKGLTLKNVH